MKKLIVTAASAMAALGLMAFEPEGAEQAPCGKASCGMSGRPVRAPQPGGMDKGAGEGRWLAAFLSKTENLERLGVTNAADRAKLQKELAGLRKQSMDLEMKIREISREQSEMLRKLLSSRSGDGSDLLAKIDEVARLRAEQGRISVASIKLLRDALPEGRESDALSLLAEFGKARGAMRMRGEGFRGEGRRDRPGRGGMNNRPAPDRGRPGMERPPREGCEGGENRDGCDNGREQPPPPPPED